MTKASENYERVLFSLMKLPAKLAAEIGTSSVDARHWLETSYYQVLRERGYTLDQIADHLDIGKRKASQLSTKLRQNFLDVDKSHGLPRRVEYLIWGEPISEQRVCQLLSHEYDETQVRAAIKRLIRQERITRSDDLLELSKTESRLYKDGALAKIDGLNHLIETVFEAVYLRFVKSDDDAFVRNLTFHIPKEDGQERLRKIYENLFTELTALESETEDDGVAINLSVLWAPKERKS